jgi:signal transduction histidine kinase
MQPAQIQDVINDAQFLMLDKIQRHGISIRSSYPQDMEVTCNSTLMSLVVGNLLSNSLDAIANLEVRWLEVGAKVENGFIEIWVMDSGGGLAPAVVKGLKKNFYTTKDAGRGTGVGLTFSRQVMSNHKGEIFYDSTSENTRFILRWPLSSNLSQPESSTVRKTG